MSDDAPAPDAPLPYVAIRALFDNLGVATFGAALPEGRIQWMNGAGEVVAHGSCEVVLSWASGNDSILWGTKLPGFAEAGVPCVPLPEAQPESQIGVTKEEAEAIATAACMGSGAPFLYEAPTGGGCLFLVVTEFHPGAPGEDAAAAAGRLDKARRWAAQWLARHAQALEADESRAEAVAALGAFARDLRNQADLVIAGLPAAASVRALAERVEDLQSVADADPSGAAAALRAEVAEVGRWGASVGDA